MKNTISVFAPASVANVGCGYDVLGFALEDIGDLLTIEKTSNGILEISEIEGASGIPMDPKKNVATVAVKAMLDSLGISDQGYLFKISKTVMPGSGLGSSASSSVAAVFGTNELLYKPLNKTELIRFAGEGEKAASGKAHYDNVAASILGGFTLVRSSSPLDILELEFPEDLCVVIAHPQVEIKTADARKILRDQIPLSTAVTQWANLSGFTVGLLRGDLDLIGRSMKDVVAEPSRSLLIPLYEPVKKAAMESGALGCNIAGSGPSIFSLCAGMESAENVLSAVKDVYSDSSLQVIYHLSKINPQGATIVSK
jgi:homoserine kinase